VVENYLNDFKVKCEEHMTLYCYNYKLFACFHSNPTWQD